MGGFALTYDVVKKRLADKQRILQIDEEEFLRIKKERPNINGYKFPVIKTCCGKSCNTSVREVGHFTDDNDLCLDCIYKSRRLTYEELVDIFAKKGCTILTTKENFELRRTTEVNCSSYAVKLKFTVDCCGGERESSFNTMRRIVNNSWQCKTCVNKRCGDVHKAKAKDSDGNVVAIQTEHQAFVYLKELLSNLFYIEKLNDGNIADCIVKPIYIDSDIWLRIQIKSTLSTFNNNYIFCMNNNNYSGLLIICVCVSDNSIWLIPGKDVAQKKGITITTNGSATYDKYKCDIDILEEMIVNIYFDDNYTFMNKCSSYIPKAITSQREHSFVLHRKKMLPFVDFIDNELDNQCYDFKIGKYKIQEKSNNSKKYNGYWYSLCKANGKNKKISYHEGDNDFYWFNTPDMALFYCIPESKMIEHGFITTESQKGRTGILFFPYPDKTSRNNIVLTSFAKEYLFDYKNIDKEKFLRLFT